MFRRKISDKEVDVKTLNDVMSLLKKILKVSYFFIIKHKNFPAVILYVFYYMGRY